MTHKRKALVAAAVVVLVGLAWLAWRHSSAAGEEEANAPTEVAVRVAALKRATLRAYVTAYGVVEPEPPGLRPAASGRVTPAVAGVVSAVTCAEGQRVEKGAVLIELDSRIADAAVAKARAAAELAEATLARQKKLLGVEGTSEKLVQEAEQARAAARDDLSAAEVQQALLHVAAPLTGMVTHINVVPGQSVDPAATLVEIVDLGRLVVSASVPSAELAALRKGAEAEVAVDEAATPSRGVLSYVGAQVDPKTGTAEVRVALAGASFRPGELVRLRIVSAEHKDVLAAPAASVVKDESGTDVVAVVQGDRAAQQPVQVGLRDGDWIEVKGEGLKPGTSVVAEGAYGLPKETKVRVLGQ